MNQARTTSFEEKNTFLHHIVLVLFFMLLLLLQGCSNKREISPVRYEVSIQDPSSHHFSVAIYCFAPAGKLNLIMPASTAGALIQNHARYVKKFNAHGQNLQVLDTLRISKDTWQVNVNQSQSITISYEVQRNEDDELRLTTNWLDKDGGYFFGTTLLMYSQEWLDTPVYLELKIPPGWQAITGLKKSRETDSFLANNYRDLVDQPVHIGIFQEDEVKLNDHTLKLIFDAPIPGYDGDRLKERIQQLAHFHLNLFGRAPFQEYTIFFHYRPDLDYGGGVSRRSCMVLNIGSEWVDNLTGNISGTFSHELFHSWNFASFYPRNLYPYDLTKENYNSLSWFVEGVTNYYVYLSFVRTGLIKPELFFQILSNDINSFENSPGRGWITLKEADFVNWIGGLEYLNVSSGGAVLGFLLDLELRLRTQNRYSLDDVMKALFIQSQQPNYKGYTDDDLIITAGEISSQDFRSFFDLYVNSKKTFDYRSILDKAGIIFNEKDKGGVRNYSIGRNNTLTAIQRKVLDSLLGQGNSERN